MYHSLQMDGREVFDQEPERVRSVASSFQSSGFHWKSWSALITLRNFAGVASCINLAGLVCKKSGFEFIDYKTWQVLPNISGLTRHYESQIHRCSGRLLSVDIRLASHRKCFHSIPGSCLQHSSDTSVTLDLRSLPRLLAAQVVNGMNVILSPFYFILTLPI